MDKELIKEEKVEFVNSLIKANFNYDNTLWLESYFSIDLNDFKDKKNVYLHCKFISENPKSRIFFSVIEQKFELSIQKKSGGKTYSIKIDEKLIDECFKTLINKYINIGSLSQKEYCEVFYDVLYFAIKNAEEIYSEDFCIEMDGDEWYLEIDC